MTTIEKPREKSAPDADDKQSGGRTALNLLIGLVVLAAGLALIFGMATPNPKTASLGGTTTSSAPASAGPAGRLAPGASTDALGAAAPTRVEVPSIGAASSLVGTGLKADGSIDTPPVSRPQQASWYDLGPTPGERGPAVVLGHVNGNGQPGVFVNLDKVVAGALVNIDRADGQRAVFKVSHVDVIAKDSFPTDLVYNTTPNAALRLITCGGDYDAAHRNYLSNVIVYADLVDVQRI